jgi:hypothetical protein
MDDADNAELIYTIRLLVKHPTIDPALITVRLGLTPHLSWAVGKVFPNFRPPESLWRGGSRGPGVVVTAGCR